MDKGYENERFESVSIKTSVAQKFTKFCKKLSKSKSMTLLLMLEFFEENGISPYESIGPKIQTLEELIKKRINGVIAIMKDIEKNQTKPTVAMMQSLFEQAEPPKKNLILEKEIPQEKPRVKFVEREQKDNKL
ncbi:BfmA/BtgA family mobilization protein [Maribacter litoralis]|uniref:BfmA/BtgA family mobilization protein n=1 Tax=Maribacter litoralis TaxID=2059726 RepID=UPI003D26DC8D